MPTTSAAVTTVVAGTGYASTTSDQGICGITRTLIKQSTNVALGGSWIVLTGAGDMTIDTNFIGTETVLVRYTYSNLASADTNAIALTVNCPALTTNSLSTVAFTYELTGTPAGTAVSTVTGTAYATSTATTHQKTQCVLTYALINKASGVAQTGTWLQISSTTGDITWNKEVRGTDVVFPRWTYPAGTTADGQDLTFTVTCPALTVVAITTFVYS